MNNKYPRIYTDSNLALCNIIYLNDIKSHHIVHVLRKKANDYVKIFNENDGEYVAKIVNITKSQTVLEIIERFKNICTAKNIKVIFSPIKQHRMSFLIEKSCELGASELYPVICEYSSNRNFNTHKFKLTAIDAAQQSGRISIPAIYNLQNLRKLLENWSNNQVILFLDVKQNSESISEFLKYNKRDDFTILVGPEGGFSLNEKEYLCSFDFIKPINLGSTILRSETAIIAALSILQTSL